MTIRRIEMCAFTGYYRPHDKELGLMPMRRILPIMLFAATGSLVANTALAQVGQGDEGVIPSDADGALPVPEQWDCSLIRPDYQDWLNADNAPEGWRYAGRQYRNVENGTVYDWQDWLDWAEDAGCPLPADAVPSTGSPTAAIGVVIGFLGTGLIAAVSGGSAKSPG